MSEGKTGCFFTIKLFLSGISWAFRETIRESFSAPRLSNLHTADELMNVVNKLTSEHGGTGMAFKYAKRALELEPNHLRANEFMANYYTRSSEFSKALLYSDRMARSNPEAVSTHVTRGEVCRKAGHLQEALDEYEVALTLSPSSPGLWVKQGELLSALGRHMEASDAYMRCLALGSNPTEAKSRLYARDPEVAVVYGRELYRAGQNDAAIEVWQAVANTETVHPKTKVEAEQLLASLK